VNAKEAKKPFKTFTGKILGNKVRVRTGPGLDSHIVKQMNKSDLLLVVGEENGFWKVQPDYGTKAYVYRTYILDNTVEANRVNVRLQPNTEAPIVAQLGMGEKIDGKISPKHSKWYEIDPPNSMCFYISKEYVGFAGGPDFLASQEKKRVDAEHDLKTAFLQLRKEIKLPFHKMSPEKLISQFEAIIQDYSEVENFAEQAKDGLSILRDNYTKKKINYLEKKADGTHVQEIVFPKYSDHLAPQKVSSKLSPKMRLWEEVEEELYLSWLTFNTNKKIKDFYAEQKVNANHIAGTVESYDPMLKNKPGDFMLRCDGNPVCYLYSTHINLKEHVGKKVKFLVSPRPNNNFAFPAYYVIGVE